MDWAWLTKRPMPVTTIQIREPMSLLSSSSPSLIRSASVARISLSVVAFQTIDAAIFLLAIKRRQQQLEESARRNGSRNGIDSTSSTFLGI